MKKLMGMGLLVRFSGRIPILLMLAVLVGLAGSPVANAAVFTVNSTDDIVDGNPGNGACDTNEPPKPDPERICTLRAAIQETNALPGADVIMLPAGMYKLTITGRLTITLQPEDSAATGDLDITDSLDIRGEDAVNTVIDGGFCADVDDPRCTSEGFPPAACTADDGPECPDNKINQNADTVFHILNPGTNPIVHISNVTIQNGGLPTNSNPIRRYNPGGVLISPGASLTLTNSIVKRNRGQEFGGGISNRGFLRRWCPA
jgi:CSLREA domain-containing protein